MGRHLDAHIARYVEGRLGFLEFRETFEGPLMDDAIAAKETALAMQGMAYALALLPNYQERLRAERERALTPEELLAALEPVKVVEERREPLTFYAAWNALADWMFTLWCNVAERVQRFWWLALACVFVFILLDGFILHW